MLQLYLLAVGVPALLALEGLAFFLAIHFKLKEILMTLDQFKVQIDQLKTQVTTTLDAEEAAAKLHIGLANMLVAAKNDPDVIQAIAARFKERTDSLSAAIVAGTQAQ